MTYQVNGRLWGHGTYSFTHKLRRTQGYDNQAEQKGPHVVLPRVCP
jgi:hypothetical protein